MADWRVGEKLVNESSYMANEDLGQTVECPLIR